MGRPRVGRALPLLLLAALCACSPAYVARSAAGEAGLLWRRRSIAKTLADPRTPPDLRAKLALVPEIRRFAFERLALRRSSDYATWTPVQGPALTWLVSASDRLRLRAKSFRFPLIGAFPYQGWFRRDLAERQAAELERRGYDAAVTGASAYNAPLVSDPLPSTLLEYDDGELAQILIHELTHGTVWFKGRDDFDEAVAMWVGARGTAQFLAERFGADSPQMKEWRADEAEGARRDALYRELKGRLAALYAGSGTDAEKLERRRAVFDWARAQAKARGLAPLPEPLNNAVVLAHELYAPNFAPFDALFDKNGRDWKRTIAALKALDPRDPFAALRRAAG
ncbi:MAG: aminopeptidase [Elusimicrobia bacterium]|nr:aminopeptidase [Elusimicrobiota bacterium]